ncbi:phage head closure protein [Proteus terrae]|uniref:phage head closure protein n=1 Tax=Proteus terrae TaxID=1574161 RepID=UPI0034D43E4E
MLAGELNKRISLSQFVTERDDLGSEKVVSKKVAEVWAKAESMSNRKIRTADQDQVIETYHFTIRPRSDVDMGWLVGYQGRLFTVRVVDRNQSDRTIITTEANIQHDRS